MTRRFYIISGGTFVDVAPHFSLAAPAFGDAGRELLELLPEALIDAGHGNTQTHLVLTRMAIGGNERNRFDGELFEAAGIKDLRTNKDLLLLTEHLVTLPETAGIVLTVAPCDFVPADLSPSYSKDGEVAVFGRRMHPRLSSSKRHELGLVPDTKIIDTIRRKRKDIFLVGFKTTDNATPEEQYFAGLGLLKRASCNLVLANDVTTRRNMVITPEQARYHETTNRLAVLEGLAEMIALRSKGTFTRATVVLGDAVPWTSPLVPASLRSVVNHCIKRGAYKPFNGATVGHFAVKVDDRTILTSIRKTDFNKLFETGLVKIEINADDPNSVTAYGFKPSVGGQSQRIIFTEHAGMDCIVHFHCPRKSASAIPVRSQREHECGSHECGQNTSDGLRDFNGVLAVMLDKHGPNIVFRRDADPEMVIRFIEENFDLEGRTDDIPATSVVAMKHAHAR